MLRRLRNPKSKKIFWIFAGVIIVAFALSGAGYYLSGRNKEVALTIDNKPLTQQDLQPYMEMARLQLLPLDLNGRKRITLADIESLALEMLILLWKAEQEKITVTDQEIVNYILENLFPQGKFDQTVYQRILKNISRRYNLKKRLTSEIFEEYVRNFITIDKLLQKHVRVEINQYEVKDLYLKDNQKAKIAYLFIPYKKFRVEVGIPPKEIEEFYQAHKSLFKREPRVNILYTVIAKSDLDDKLLKKLSRIKSVAELKQKLSLEMKETGLIGLNDPIADIGWQPQINELVYTLEKNVLSRPLQTEKGLLIVAKKDEQLPATPPLHQIEAEVREKLIAQRAKNEAESFSQDLLEKIRPEKKTDLKSIARRQDLEFKETDYFKFYDYIEGIGLDLKVSEIIFSLEKGQVDTTPISGASGVYIIKLVDISPFDSTDFEKKKPDYLNVVRQSKSLIQKNKFLQQLEQEADVRFAPLAK